MKIVNPVSAWKRFQMSAISPNLTAESSVIVVFTPVYFWRGVRLESTTYRWQLHLGLLPVASGSDAEFTKAWDAAHKAAGKAKVINLPNATTVHVYLATPAVQAPRTLAKAA